MATDYQAFLKSPGARRYYRQMKAGLGANASAPSSGGSMAALQAYIDSGNTPSSSAPARPKQGEADSFLTKALDVALQPGYAVAEMLNRGVAGVGKTLENDVRSGATDEDTNPVLGLLKASRGAWPEALKGGNPLGTGNDKLTVSDALRGSENYRGSMKAKGDAVFTGGMEGPGDQGFLATDANSSVLERGIKATAGFAADVAYDPLTYVTLGGVGAGVRHLGNRAIAAGGIGTKVGEVAVKAGDAAIKTDNLINRAILHPIKTGKGAANAVGRALGKDAAEEVVEEVVEAAPKVIAPKNTKEAVKQATTELGEEAEKKQGVLDFLTANPPEPKPTEVLKRGLIPADRLIPDETSLLPFSSRKLAQTKRDITPESAIERLKVGDSRYVSPFKVEDVARTNTPTVESVAAAAPEVKAAETIAAAMKPLSAKPTDSEIKGWLKANAEEKVSYTHGSINPTTGKRNIAEVTVAEAARILKLPTTSARVREELIKSLGQRGRAGVLSERSRAVAESAVEGSARAPEALGGSARVTGSGRGSSPLQAQQDASAALAGRSVVQRNSREVDAIRKKYRRSLSERAFDHLWDSAYLKDPNLTPAQKQREWEKRIRDIRRGLKTEEPAYYEVFYSRQVHPELLGQRKSKVKPNEKSVADTAQPGTASAQLNEELASVPTAPELAAAVDQSIEAADVRIGEAAKILRGDNLSEVEWNALRAISGNADMGHGATGQQWAGRAAEFDKTTPIQGTARDAAEAGVGRGVNIESYNSKAQLNAFRNIFDQVRAQVDATPNLRPDGSGRPDSWGRAAKLRSGTTSALVNVEAFLRAHGVEPVLGTLKSGVPYSVGDMLTAMSSTRLGRQFLDSRVFGGPQGIKKVNGYEAAPGTVYIDDLMRVFESVVDKLDGDAISAAKAGSDVLEAIQRTVTDVLGSKKVNRDTLVDALLDGGKKPLTVARKGKVEPIDPEYAKGIMPNTSVIVKTLEDALFGEEGNRILLHAAETIQQRAAANSIRFGDNVAELSRDALDEVVDFISGTPSLKESVDLLSNPEAMVSRLAKARPKHVNPLVTAAAKERVAEELSDIISPWDQADIKTLSSISKASTPQDIKKAALGTMEEVARQVDEIPHDPEYFSIADQVVQDVTTTKRRVGLWATDHFMASHVVDAATGRVRTNQLGREFLRSHSNNVNLSQSIAKSLNEINRMGGVDELSEAYRFVQGGRAGTVSPKVAEIAEQIHRVNNMFFGSTVKASGTTTEGILPTFMANGYDIRHVKDKLTRAHFDFSDAEKFDWTKIEGIKDRRLQAEEILSQWQKMDIKDPISFLGKMSAAFTSLSADMSMSQNLAIKLSELGFTSPAYKPGMVLLKDTDQNIVTRYFPNESLWVDKEIIPDIQRIDSLLKETVNFGSGTVGRFISTTYAPLLAKWKAGVTIWRPGHHVRNLVGDVSLSFLADGVKDPRYYNAAATMMRNRAKYQGVDLLRIAQGLDTKDLIGDGRQFSIKLNKWGGKTVVSYDEAYDAAMHQGILKDFSVQEDLIEATDTPQWLDAALNSRVAKPLGGRGKDFVGTVSQARDDYVRMAHFLHLLQHPQKAFKSTDELYEWAAARVDKVHPDGTGLTATEKKLRYAIPFYSWTRKSIPLVLEAAMQHPGRVLIAPKAMYNIAQANGLELESMSDPFPDDQLFPSWVTDSMSGPIYQDSEEAYWTISPGDVSTDTLGFLGSADLKGEVLDMMSPALKLPFELHFGQTFGKKIKTPGLDPLEYIGQQIPGVSHVQQLTGKDVLGSAASLIQGQGLDDTMSVKRGNRGNIEQNQFLNFLTGIQSRNVSTPSTINSAEIEQRDRLKKEKG